MRELCAFLRQRLVVVLARKLRVKREVELVFPSKLESRLRQRVILKLRAGVSLREISRVRRNLVSNNTVFNVLPVGQAKVLFRRDVAQHRRAEPANHRRAYRGRDVIVTRRDVGYERAERVE